MNRVLEYFILTFAILVPLLAFMDLAHANGNGSIHHNNVAVGVGVGEGGSATATGTGGIAYGIGGEVGDQSNAQSLGLTQDIKLDEKSLTNIAPALTSGAHDCTIVSNSYSVLVWSKGKAKCDPGSAAWRDFRFAAQSQMGSEVAIGFLCQYKKFRKLSHLLQLDGEPVDCKALLKKPKPPRGAVKHYIELGPAVESEAADRH